MGYILFGYRYCFSFSSTLVYYKAYVQAQKWSNYSLAKSYRPISLNKTNFLLKISPAVFLVIEGALAKASKSAVNALARHGVEPILVGWYSLSVIFVKGKSNV